MSPVAAPIAIFVVCVAAGIYASTRWLPELAPGPVGGLAYFAVCGLLAAALVVFGLDVYGIVESLSHFPDLGKGVILANGLEQILWQTGLLIGAALAVYLLAPPREEPDVSLASGADPDAGAA
jgi:hypothetical protein